MFRHAAVPALLAAFGFAIAMANVPVSSPLLEETLADFQADMGLNLFVRELSSKSGLAVCLLIAADNSGNTWIKLDLKEPTVRAVLDTAVAQCPSYMWIDAGGNVINVLPKEDYADSGHWINSTAPELSVDNLNVLEAFASLFRASLSMGNEVPSMMQHHLLENTEFPMNRQYETGVSTVVTNGSMMDALNSIVRAADCRVAWETSRKFIVFQRFTHKRLAHAHFERAVVLASQNECTQGELVALWKEAVENASIEALRRKAILKLADAYMRDDLADARSEGALALPLYEEAFAEPFDLEVNDYVRSFRNYLHALFLVKGEAATDAFLTDQLTEDGLSKVFGAGIVIEAIGVLALYGTPQPLVYVSDRGYILPDRPPAFDRARRTISAKKAQFPSYGLVWEAVLSDVELNELRLLE